jgi:tetratricopeptide (TPR) repeat protein
VYLTDLANTPIAEILRRLAYEQSNGDLHIRSGKLAKTIFFDHGRVVFAASNLRKDRLGESLLSLGRITDADFRQAQALMKKDRHRRFGEALVQAGVMDKNELGTSVARQVRRIVTSLFEFADGAASFDERECVIPLDFMVSVSVPKLLYDGIRAMKNEALIRNGLGDMDRWVRLAAVTPFPFDPGTCSEEEREILEHARRRVTLRRLAWAPGGVTLPRLRATYALLASGVLQPDGEGEEFTAPPPIQMETGNFLLSALRKRPDPSARTALRQEVHEELERSARLDRETWLKVSRNAPKEELVRALEEKMEHYHALRDAVGDDDLRTDIELILGRAASVLRLAKGVAEAQATTTAAMVPPVGLPPKAAPPAPAEAEPEGGDTGSGSGKFSGQALIDHLLVEGEVRMTVSDYANAVRTYARLVDAAPRVAAFRARLAIAMACYPKTAKQAEREFLEAVRLEPDSPDLHYQFGLYYKAMRQRARSVAELRAAVRLNPRHRLARQELEALSPKDTALTSLKKLFK